MTDYLSRAGKIFLIMITVVLAVAYVKGLADNRDMQTPTEAEGHIYRVTAFCPKSCCCGKWADGYTASGKLAQGKLIAAPPKIPFGTWIDIPGYGMAEVLDRGGSIKGRRLDLLFPTHQKALEWGVKYLRIKL